ncbi:MAG: hypothetical protein GY938_12915 [Ketobacter sp.]|nr:hypothetical protein [Ketobacter sp.]
MAEGLGVGTLIPGGARLDASTFGGEILQSLTVDNGAGYAIGATSIAIDAHVGTTIRSGSFLEYTSVVPGTFLRLSADVVAGDVAASVYALPAALVDNQVVDLVGDPKIILGGSVVGRTIAQRDANTPLHKALDTDEEFYLIAFDVIPQFGERVEAEWDVDLVRHAALVKENLLPTFAVESATVQAAVRAAYQTTIGVD